ncbi:right-handed parallel beta-helix repeat-containing protein [Arenibacter sp. S6351L]|uniref:right-handed parallel beta-helix repeat-containing protein n=1 Tax=Arenibacter sp. S6351L TaxID=2926407 RepID=UPI001FF6166B|nr:right-handed parallel beta-helix repeat-containing protein [Arenibacter sp. S6351L]MCK0132964.1 right-handed parallel beta-helix repeat-containing protein [Arenibacter sp. S6351L]
MKRESHLKILFFAVFILMANLSLAQEIKEIYVSPSGYDSNSGTYERPFKTLGKATAALVTMDSRKLEKIVVWLNDGIYRISNPIVIDSTIKKSGTPFEFKAVEGSSPTISGAVELKDWSNLGDGIWVSEVPKNLGVFRELFVKGKRAMRARHPNNEYLRVKEVGADRRTNFTYHTGDFPQPKIPGEVELVVLHDWSITRIPIKDISLDSHTITASDSIGAKGLNFFNLDNWEPNPRYYLENDIEFLDAEYEWYLDTSASKIYLKLPMDLEPSQLSIEVPLAESLLAVEGSEQNPISNISFEGIRFKHCRWNIPNQTYAGIQACNFDTQQGNKEWAVVPAAIRTTWAHNIRFKDCEFNSLGGSGIWLGTGTINSTITSCRIRDISGNGVMIGEGQDRLVSGESWWKAAPQQAALGNTVEDCDISDCGVQFYGAVGIWCGLTAETILKNNEIYNLPYTGISIGWMWSPEPTPCRDNTIAENHIHHVMQKLSDGGGIYMLGLQPGSKLIDNNIHDISVNAGRAESNGMFLDEGTKDVLVENNLIYNIAKSPLRFHKASTNFVKNNYLFSNGETPAIAYNNTLPENIHQEGNREISTDDPNYIVALKKAVSKHIPTPNKP